MRYAVGRDDVLSALRGALEPLDHVQAMWEAAAFYQSYTLRPLVEALRILHDPTRHKFHTRYVHYDFPEEDVGRLAELSFVAEAGEIAAKRGRAERWFHEILGEINDGPFTEDIERTARRTRGGRG